MTVLNEISSSKAYDLALLAEISYADLEYVITRDAQGNIAHVNDDKLKKLLDADEKNTVGNATKVKLSKTQAEYFIKNFEIVAHKENTTSGFSGTIFKRLNWDSASGEPEYIFSPRGTEPNSWDYYKDLASADFGDIVLNGLAWKQIVDMYNFWQEATTPKGQKIQKAEISIELINNITVIEIEGVFYPVYSAITMMLQAVSDGQSLDKFSELIRMLPVGSPGWNISLTTTDKEGTWSGSPINEKENKNVVDVSGHSLGGHLATAFSRLFSDKVKDILTVNGAGYSIFGSIFGNTNRLFAALEGDSGFNQNGVNIINLYGNKGPNFTTQDLFLQQVGKHEGLFIEDPGNIWGLWAKGHDKIYMTNGTAMINLLAKIDPTFGKKPLIEGLGITNNLLAAMAEGAKENESLERLVEKLAAFFLNDPSKIATDDREALYAKIELIQKAIPENGFKFISLISSSDDIYKIAATDINTLTSDSPYTRDQILAYRYALVNLNPFVITGMDYSRFNGGNALELYNPKTGNGLLTKQYLEDRAAMLQALITYNTNGGAFVHQTDYKDQGQKINLDLSNFMGWDPEAGSYPINFKQDQDILFGSDNSDNQAALSGFDGDKARNQYIYGGAGVDELVSGTGQDYLEGGLGNDTYTIGKGQHTILDIDGEGKVTYLGEELTFFNPSLWKSDDKLSGNGWIYNNQWQLLFIPAMENNRPLLDSSGKQIYTLQISKVDDKENSLTILHYKEGNLGIKGLESLSNVMAITDKYSNPIWDNSQQAILTKEWAGGSTSFNLFFRRMPKIGERISFTFGGAIPNLFMVRIGAKEYEVTGGSFDYIVDSDYFINDCINVSMFTSGLFKEDGELSITATYSGKDGINSTSVTANYEIKGSEEGDISTTNRIEIEYLKEDILDGEGNIIKAREINDDNEAIVSKNSNDDTKESSGNDLIIAEAGIDNWIRLYAGGNDRVEGKDGNDGVLAGSGNDTLIGEEGRDVLIGGAGNDTLYGDKEINLEDKNALERHNTEASSDGDWAKWNPDSSTSNEGKNIQWGDWLNGGAGDDNIVGSHAADRLYGGAGDDVPLTVHYKHLLTTSKK